jgi:hypothetical protein
MKLLTLALFMVLTACGSKGGGGSPAASTAPAGLDSSIVGVWVANPTCGLPTGVTNVTDTITINADGSATEATTFTQNSYPMSTLISESAGSISESFAAAIHNGTFTSTPASAPASCTWTYTKQ